MSVEVGESKPVIDQDGDAVNIENGNALFGKDSSENMPVKEERVIRKAKRLTKPSPKKDGDIINGVSNVHLTSHTNRYALSKNSRKSRNGYGRGLPKKGGAGGKGVWGKPGAELEETPIEEDDPNYDSDSTANVVVKAAELELSVEELEKAVAPVLREYLEHGDTDEVIRSLQELPLGGGVHHVAVLAVAQALEHHAPHREMTSRLVSDMYARLLSLAQMERVFDHLLTNLPDLILDTPDAPAVVGQFIARAVADDCLPPKFVSGYKGNVECPLARQALDKADVLLNMKHGIVRLDNVWGVGGGNRPVKYLIKRMVLLLKEYQSSNDVEEAIRCLKELDVPHFHHELVYEALVMSIEDSTDYIADQMVRLLKVMTNINLITPDQLNKGFKRVFDSMPDICLDVPAAYSLLERVGGKLHSQGVLPDVLYKEIPIRGRKRFVSEGDGGRLKEVM